MATRRTKYQSSHYPKSVVEVKCTNLELNDRDMCTACGRWLKRRVKHNPDVTGSLGWIENYADGSTYQVAPNAPVSSLGH